MKPFDDDHQEEEKVAKPKRKIASSFRQEDKKKESVPESTKAGRQTGFHVGATGSKRIRFKKTGKVSLVGWKQARAQVASGRAEYID